MDSVPVRLGVLNKGMMMRKVRVLMTEEARTGMRVGRRGRRWVSWDQCGEEPPPARTV